MLITIPGHAKSMENKHIAEHSQPGGMQEEKESADIYVCSRCGHALFEAAKMFDSRTGFPSFWLHIGENVRENFLDTYGRERVQLLCSNCGQHLGHLFDNKVTPSRLRYCINNSAIAFKKTETHGKME